MLGVSYERLTVIFLQIKAADRATNADLNQLLALNIPVYQSIFAHMKNRRILPTASDYQISFNDTKAILCSLIERKELLYKEGDVTPRYQFFHTESIEIKKLLRHAKGLNRKIARRYYLI